MKEGGASEEGGHRTRGRVPAGARFGNVVRKASRGARPCQEAWVAAESRCGSEPYLEGPRP